MMRAHKLLLPLAFACLPALALGACSSTRSTSSLPSPGHSSPQAAVVGLITGIQKHDGTECSYVVPESQAECRSTLLAVFQQSTVTGFALGKTTTVGNQSIVSVLATKACIGGQCVSNSDPNQGQPNGSTTFAQAYKDGKDNSATTTAVLERVAGLWYIVV